jgi:chemotaxis protein methyltransferase CheR
MLVADGDVAPINADILGSDLSSAALDKARAGLYTHFEVQRGLPIRRMLDHFEEVDDAWRASAALRAAVRWKRINLVDPLSGGAPFDLILCRYVVSAFAPEARATALATLSASLADHGRLVLGTDEAPPPGFEADAVAAGVFRRPGASTLHYVAA